MRFDCGGNNVGRSCELIRIGTIHIWKVGRAFNPVRTTLASRKIRDAGKRHNEAMHLIRLNQFIINPNQITAIMLESGSACTVHFARATTPPIKLNGSETTQLLSALRSALSVA
jgi:hypothetical protein